MNNGQRLGVLAGMVVAAAALAQPVQWRVEDGGNGHWYEAPPQPFVSWQAASNYARSIGGHLATCTSAAENAFVAGLRSGEVMLGGFQDPSASDFSEPAGGWRWVTGEPWVYTAWNPTPEPNNGGWPDYSRGENYLGFWRFEPSHTSSNWNDFINSATQIVNLHAVIEWSADCNNDGIVDKGQILSGQLADANNNGIPDGPAISTQPTDQSVGVDSPVTFYVELTNQPGCTTALNFQWQRRNPAVADPAAAAAWIDLADGGGLLGTHAANLLITHPTPSLATGYRCKIGGGCGCDVAAGAFVYTNTVNFSVACPADFNADGGIDFSDVEAFFERWENGC